MLSTEKIKNFIRQPELISSDELPHLLELANIFPMSSTFKLLYLNGLKNCDDLRFNSEMERLAAGISDRSQLYFLSKKLKDVTVDENTLVQSSTPISSLETVNEPNHTLKSLTQQTEETTIKNDELQDTLQTETLATLSIENQKEEILTAEKNENQAIETAEINLQEEVISTPIESKSTFEEPLVEEIIETPIIDIKEEVHELASKMDAESEIVASQTEPEVSNQINQVISDNVELLEKPQELIEVENEFTSDNEGFSILLSLNEDKKELETERNSENDDLSELYLAEASGQDYLSSLPYEEEVNEEIEAAISLVELVGDVEIEEEKEVIEEDTSLSSNEIENKLTAVKTEKIEAKQSQEPLTISTKRSFTDWLKVSTTTKSQIEKENTIEEKIFEEEKAEEINAFESIEDLTEVKENQEQEVAKIETTESNENESAIEFIPIERPKKEFFNPIKKAKESLDEEKMPVSETLAKIFVLQKNYSKAIYVYEQLGLIFPEKKSFFAAQIENINKKIKE